MKVTLIRKDKENVEHLTTRTIDGLMARIMTDTKGTVRELRRRLPLLAGLRGEFADMHLLHRVYPAVELARNAKTGDIEFRRWNGLVLLTVGSLGDSEQTELAKQTAMGLPSTLAAFTGSSGRTVKLLVRIVAENGVEPQSEKEADRLYQSGYQYAVRVYGGLFAGRIVEENPSARASFRMTLDERPLLNPKATPLWVASEPPLPHGTVNQNGLLHGTESLDSLPPGQDGQRKTDYDKYNDYEYLYHTAEEQVLEEMGDRFDGDPHRHQLYLTELVRRLRLMGFPKEEAVLHTRSHLWTRTEDEHIRAIVDSVYTEPAPKGKADVAGYRVRKAQQDIIRFLESRYVFRYNTVMGYTEYRPNNTWVHPFVVVDERVTNRMAIECRLAGLDAWDKDIVRYLRSAFVPTYNPVEEYLAACRGKWDGKDRIRQLASTVPTKNEHWTEWFYTWYLAMVRQWQSSVNDRYGNQTAPLLISKQGWNKSTFIQSLLPLELQWGYTNQLNVSEKKQTLQAMSQFLLISLDEFNQISPQLQQGFLKNVISLPSVKVRRPYGSHIEPFPRLASFIGATNQTDVLTDPSGARRFLGVELSGPIDVSHMPNHRQLIAQALHALEHGEPCYFNEEQTQQIIASNRQFQQQSPVEHYFHEYFEVATGESDGRWLTATAIFAHIKKLAGADLRLTSLNHFGRILSNIDQMQRHRSSRGTEYLVKLRKNRG